MEHVVNLNEVRFEKWTKDCIPVDEQNFFYVLAYYNNSISVNDQVKIDIWFDIQDNSLIYHHVSKRKDSNKLIGYIKVSEGFSSYYIDCNLLEMIDTQGEYK